jgi:predicted NUDIX family NTP pyrophosphohydrolase
LIPIESEIRTKAAMGKKSAGILLFRKRATNLEVLLVHPGGPFWSKKDDGAWSIPKGEFNDDEDPLAAARREFEEETGSNATGDAIALGPVRQASGKLVYAFAMNGEFDVSRLESNTFTMEWPPRSGKQQIFPEVDRAAWFALDAARRKILKGQAGLLDELERKLGQD